jgi:hypothetical protein
MALLLVAILVFGLVACGGNTAAPTEPVKTNPNQPAEEATEAPAAEDAPRAERVLRMDGMSNSGYPSPFTASAKGAGYVVVQYIFDTLVWKDENGFFNYLAEDYDVSPDNLTYTFKLREGVLWNDGKPFTAEDVKFSFDYYALHPYSWVNTQKVKEARVVDELTVEIELKDVYVPFIADIASNLPIIPKHVYENVEDPTTFIGGYEFQAQLTNGFLNGFLNGTAFAGWKSYTTGSYAAIEVKKDFTNTALVNYYGALNGLAQTDATTHIVADPAATIKEYNEELRLYLTSSVQNVFTELRKGDLMETAKAKYNTNIAGIFNELLAEAVANLDEVYNRFLFEDFKADKINETYAYATEIANFYSGAGDTALIEAMEHYLTGYSVTAATAPAAGVTTNKLFPAEASLVNASLTTELAGLTVNKFDKINGVDKVALTATNAMAQVVTIVTGYELKVENMAIKDNFQSYLDVATTNVARAYLNYMAIPSLTYDMINLLVADRNSADTAITIQKFQNEMGLIALDNYKTEYTKLLTLIAGEAQKAHFEYLTGKTWAQGEAAIKSTETHSYLSGINNVVKPVDALGLGAYGFVGTSIVSFDRTVNVNTKYTEGTAPNIVIKNLYE